MFTPPTTRGRDVGTSVRSAWFTMVGRRRRDQRGQAEAAAYCVSGRHPMVIVTTGALRALDAGQLDAVWRMNELTLPAVTTGCWPWPGAAVPAADAGRGCTGGAANGVARRRCGTTGQRSPVTGHRPGRSCHGRQPRACSRRGCHRRGAADPPAARPAEQLGRVHRQLCEPPQPRSRWPRLLLALAPAAAAGAWTSSGYLAGRSGRATTMPGSQPDACPPAAGRLQPKWAP